MDEKNFGFIISPSLVRREFVKGEIYSDSFTFTNAFYDDEADTHQFYVYVRFLYQDGNNNIIYNSVPTGKEHYAMNNWVALKEDAFILKKGAKKEISYSINVPEDAYPGGKYAAIVISKQNPDELENKTGAVLTDEIAYQIIGNVEGETRRSADIIDFSVNEKVFWLWPFEKATFNLTFKNQGNVAYKPSGEVYLHTGDITKDIWNKEFNPNELIVLPENIRSYSLDWKAEGGPFKSNREGVTLNLDYVRFGRYIATAKVGIEQNNQRLVVDKVTSFYIIPLPLIVTILGIIAILSIKRRSNTKKGRK